MPPRTCSAPRVACGGCVPPPARRHRDESAERCRINVALEPLRLDDAHPIRFRHLKPAGVRHAVRHGGCGEQLQGNPGLRSCGIVPSRAMCTLQTTIGACPVIQTSLLSSRP
eukprot:6457604-Prymnesium_polylepis.1